MEDLVINTTSPEPCHFEVGITVPAGEVNKVFGQTLKQFRQYGQVPGFRPGKSPDKLLRQRFGGQIAAQATQLLVEEGVKAALPKAGLKPATLPTLKDAQAELLAKENADLAFTIEFDVAPECPLPEYKGLALSAPAVAVSEQEVDGALDMLRRRHVTYAEVTGAAALDHLLQVGYQAELPADLTLPEDAQPLVTVKETWVQLGPNEFIPGFTAALTGAAKGDVRTFPVTFPEDFRHEALRGKTLAYTVTVLQIQAQQLPPLDDAFAKLIGAETLAELRTNMSGYLQHQQQENRRRALEVQANAALEGAADFALPPRVVEIEMQSALRVLISRLQRENKTRDEIQGQADALRAEANAMARGRVKLRYLCEKIAEAEQITVSDEDVTDFVTQFRAQSGLTEAQFERQYDEYALAGMAREQLLSSRVLARMIELATVTDQAPPAPPAPPAQA